MPIDNAADPLARRALGRTDLLVTGLTIGSGPLGDMPGSYTYGVSEECALATLRAVFAGPINFLDTAAIYGNGESERRIGLALREHGGVPAGFVIGTKADRDPDMGDFSGDQIRGSIEESLRRLGLSRIDLLHLHDAEHTTFENVMSPGGPLEVMRQYRDQGVVRYLGVAGGPIDQEIRFVETGAFDVVLTHNRYTLLNRSAEPLLEAATRLGVAVLNAAPYGGGLLARGPAAFPRYSYHDATPEILDRAQRLEAICARYDVALPAAALQFSLRESRIASTVVGLSRPERVDQTIELARAAIPAACWDELLAVPSSASDPEADRWGR